MKPKGYEAQYYGHIESLDYRDSFGRLWLRCGCGSSRIYFADTAELNFSRRERVLENLCDYYATATNPAIVVIDEKDKDRQEIERTIARLSAEGQKITIEYVTEETQRQFEKGWHLKWLSAGKKLKLGGMEISTIEDYVRWKEAQGAPPDGGPAEASGDSSPSGGRHR